jgi:hypothetical protein
MAARSNGRSAVTNRNTVTDRNSVTDRNTGHGRPQGPLPPMDRVLMLIALGLDPRYKYTNFELQSAWRRRISQVHPERGGNVVVAAAVNASYLTLARHGADWEAIDLRM